MSFFGKRGFVFSDSNKSLSPKEFGFVSVQKALSALLEMHKTLRSFAGTPLAFNECSLFNMVSDEVRQFFDLNFIAYDLSAYISFARNELEVSESLFKEIGVGVGDGLRRLRDINGKELSDQLVTYSMQKAWNYAVIIRNPSLDYSAGEVTFGSEVALEFVNSLASSLQVKVPIGKDFAKGELIMLPMLLTSSTAATYEMLAENLKYIP
jgi:hypothetical protein